MKQINIINILYNQDPILKMHTNSSSGLNNTKYVPPSQRKSNETQKWIKVPIRNFEKKFSEFSITDSSSFPTLESSANKNKTKNANIMSFAAATKYEEPKKEGKISEFKPGWVYIRKNNSGIEYKYEPQLQKTMVEQLKKQLKCEESHHLRNLKSRISRLQWDQDRENNRLGDLSPFHDSISIKEQLDEAYINDEDENIHSYNSDNYVNGLSDSENIISLPENK